MCIIYMQALSNNSNSCISSKGQQEEYNRYIELFPQYVALLSYIAYLHSYIDYLHCLRPKWKPTYPFLLVGHCHLQLFHSIQFFLREISRTPFFAFFQQANFEPCPRSSRRGDWSAISRSDDHNIVWMLQFAKRGGESVRFVVWLKLYKAKNTKLSHRGLGIYFNKFSSITLE